MPEFEEPTSTVTRPPVTRASSDLLIGQWKNDPIMRAFVDSFTAQAREEIQKAIEDLERMRNVETAEGIWLDYIGERVGLKRPYASGAGTDSRFGFDDAGIGFDQAPFQGDEEFDTTFPLPDVLYRRFIKARTVSLFTRGTVGDFSAACKFITPSVVVIDNMDMSVHVIVHSSFFWQFRLADKIHALPRPAGVRMVLDDLEYFGFDDSGKPFDVGRFYGS